MIKRLLLIATMAVATMGSFAADLVGTWNVRNLNNIKETEDTPQRLGKGLDFCFGILGTAKTIEFKADGTFFCNDSVYGTYTYKDDQLILTRDEKLVNMVIDRLKAEDTTQTDSNYWKEALNGYTCDSILISFSKQGHKALLEGNQQRDMVKSLLPINLTFLIDKQGTNGKNEDLNEGKSIIGKKYKISMMGMLEMAFTFKKNGKCIGESGGFGQMEEKKMTYAINGNKLSIYEKNAPTLEGEYIFSKDGFLFIFANESKGMTLALTFWEVK